MKCPVHPSEDLLPDVGFANRLCFMCRREERARTVFDGFQCTCGLRMPRASIDAFYGGKCANCGASWAKDAPTQEARTFSPAGFAVYGTPPDSRRRLAEKILVAMVRCDKSIKNFSADGPAGRSVRLAEALLKELDRREKEAG